MLFGKLKSNLLSSIQVISIRDVLQISVNYTILFLMELIFEYSIIGLKEQSLFNLAKTSRSEFIILSVFEEEVGT